MPSRQERLAELNQLLVATFVREPGPDDPLFFDPDADTPTPIDEKKMEVEMVISMIRAGTTEHLIYAFVRTALILTKKTYRTVPAEIRAEWDLAMQDYERLSEKP
jgi:hypothetical protein